MPYRDEINVVPHDFTTTTVVLNGEHTVQGLDVLEVSKTDDTYSNKAVADGTAVHQKNNSRIGQIRMEILEASATSDVLWDAYENDTAIQVAIVDSNAPNLKVNNTYCRIQKQPMLVRKGEVENVEWILNANYLNYRGGSYRLES